MPSMTADRVRVWVVDDQASFRRAAVEMLATTKGFVLAGECDTGQTAIELIRDGGAGIVLMDVHMPGMGGIEATRRIRATPQFDGPGGVNLRRRRASSWGRGLRRRGLRAQRKSVSGSADPVMASS
jgi:CheY-like chemotaxis protein